MIRTAALAVCIVAGMAITPALADEPATTGIWAPPAADGALDSASLEAVSGGTLVGDPTDAAAWRGGEGFASPVDVVGIAGPAGSGIAGAAMLGAEMGHRPPAGDTIGGVGGGVAGDIANTLF